MKRQIVLLLLVGGLVAGLCGCGGSSGDSLPGMVVESTSSPMEITEEAVPEEAEDIARGEYSTDDLINMWLSGEITREDIWRKVAYGEISYEVYEEFLECIPNSQEFDDIQSDEMPESENIEINTDALSLLTEHAIEFEDPDGYRIRETIQLSPIFTEDDMETVYALWEALGNDVSSFPSEDSIYAQTYMIRNIRDTCSCDKLEYIIGTYALENLTYGFPITSDNPRHYIGALCAERVSAFDDEHDSSAATILNLDSVTMALYSSGPTYYSENDTAIFIRAKMNSDVWGPTCFVIAIPNGSTPNRPDGYRCDKILIQSDCMRFTNNGEKFTLEYYTKEVE